MSSSNGNSVSPHGSSSPLSDDALRATLAKLSHLDLTGGIDDIVPVMKAHGGNCDVFTGHSQHHQKKVAIKRVRVHIHGDQNFAKSLAKELRVWSKLEHPNVLPLLGYMLEGYYPSLISEWMENGTVATYLKTHPNADIKLMVLNIAEGLEYLHRNNIIHSDIKADNVLVSALGHPLICDFGISRMLAASQTFSSSSHSAGAGGTVRWMAIELLVSDGGESNLHTKESDVWAFGMTVHELLSQNLPFSNIRIEVQVMLAIIRGDLPSPPDDWSTWEESRQALWVVGSNCWEKNPRERPTMLQIIKDIQSPRMPMQGMQDISAGVASRIFKGLKRFIGLRRSSSITATSTSLSISSPRTSTSSSLGIMSRFLPGESERERFRVAVGRLEPDSGRVYEITKLLMGLSKRDRAMCLFNDDVLRKKVVGARRVLDTADINKDRWSLGSESPMIAPASYTNTLNARSRRGSMTSFSPMMESPYTDTDISYRETDGPFSGSDAQIIADAFRKALRKPDFADAPADEPESPENVLREMESPGLLDQELAEEGRDLRSVGSSRGVRVDYPSDGESDTGVGRGSQF